MKYKRFKIIFFFSFLFFNCSLKQNEKISMLSGYIYWQQKNWNRSLSDFLNVYQTGMDKENEEIKIYADFALASVYLMQNENEAARQRLSNVNFYKDSFFEASVYYQLGVIAFKSGEYSESAEYFKKALMKDSKSIDIKINYELSKKYAENMSSNTQPQNSFNLSEINNDDIDYNIIIDIIRKKEAEEWKKNNQNSNSKNAHDY